MLVYYLSHFININTLYHYKTKLYLYNTLLMSKRMQHINHVDSILFFEM
jgi:hypothetical protein